MALFSESADVSVRPAVPGDEVAMTAIQIESWRTAHADVLGAAVLDALEVLPSHQRGGHGSRLLSAAVDRLRQDGSAEVVAWILDGDTAREQFLGGAGLGPDQRTRTLATGVRDVVEHRWSATI